MSGFFARLFGRPAEEKNQYAAPAPDAHVTPDAARCVQCGVCGHNCPVGIPVREYARQGLIVEDSRCVQCGKCVEVCPRGTLRWTRPSTVLEKVNADEYESLMREVFGAAN